MSEEVYPADFHYEEYRRRSFDPMKGSEWYQPHTEWPNIPEQIFKLPDYYSFDLATIRTEVLDIVTQQGLHPHQNGGYTGIALTAPSGLDRYSWWTKQGENGEEIFPNKKHFHPSSPPPSIHEFPYEIEQPYLTPGIKKLMRKFKSKITKVSIVRLQAKGAIVPHLDFPYYRTIRLHASIVTNPNMFYEYATGRYVIPADGNFYFLNAGVHHGVINNGNEDRINLSFNLNPDQSVLREHGFRKMVEECLL